MNYLYSGWDRMPGPPAPPLDELPPPAHFPVKDIQHLFPSPAFGYPMAPPSHSKIVQAAPVSPDIDMGAKQQDDLGAGDSAAAAAAPLVGMGAPALPPPSASDAPMAAAPPPRKPSKKKKPGVSSVAAPGGRTVALKRGAERDGGASAASGGASASRGKAAARDSEDGLPSPKRSLTESSGDSDASARRERRRARNRVTAKKFRDRLKSRIATLEKKYNKLRTRCLRLSLTAGGDYPKKVELTEEEILKGCEKDANYMRAQDELKESNIDKIRHGKRKIPAEVRFVVNRAAAAKSRVKTELYIARLEAYTATLEGKLKDK